MYYIYIKQLSTRKQTIKVSTSQGKTALFEQLVKKVITRTVKGSNQIRI